MATEALAHAPLGEIKFAVALESEIFVVGCMMGGEEAVRSVMAILDEEDLYRPMNRAWYRLIVGLMARGAPIDELSLQAIARADVDRYGGLEYFAVLFDYRFRSDRVEWHARKVKSASIMRQFQQACWQGYHADPAEIEDTEAFLDDAHRRLYQLATQCVSRGLQPMAQMVMQLSELYEQRFANPVDIVGLSTGFPAIDRYLEGLKDGYYYVLAGRPSMGKTACALAIAENVARGGQPVAVFSYEMPQADLISRVVCARAKVHKRALETGKIQAAPFERAMKTMSEIYELPIFIDDDKRTNMAQMSAKCRQLKMSGGLGLVVVDHLGLVPSRGKHSSRREEVDEISRDLKLMAMELQCPVLALSQLSRASQARENKRPVLTDLRESGGIEQDADAVMFVYRDAYYQRDKTHLFGPDGRSLPEQAEILVEKHRNGPIGTARIEFMQEFARFSGLPDELASMLPPDEPDLDMTHPTQF